MFNRLLDSTISLAAVCVAALISACATVEPPDGDASPLASLPTPQEGTASVVLARPTGVASGNTYGVLVRTGEADYRGVGLLQGQQYLVLPLEPARHHLCVYRVGFGIDQCIAVTVAAGERRYLQFSLDGTPREYDTQLHEISEAEMSKALRGLKPGTKQNARVRWSRGNATGTHIGR
jgi:hypothetical protein